MLGSALPWCCIWVFICSRSVRGRLDFPHYVSEWITPASMPHRNNWQDQLFVHSSQSQHASCTTLKSLDNVLSNLSLLLTPAYLSYIR